MHVTRRMCCAVTVLALSIARADAASVKDVFEAGSLLGTWAMNCDAEASADNPYVVFRAVENYVQRDTMASATERLDVSIIEFAAAIKPDQMAMRIANERGRLDLVVRIEPKRMRSMDISLANGGKIVADGRTIQNGAEVPWLNKCSP